MANTYLTIPTNMGSTKIAAAIATGVPLLITQAAVGDGNGSYYVPAPLQTELRGEQWRGGIVYSGVDSDELSMFNVRFIVPAEVGGFTVREAALFDEDGDMIFICNLPDTKKEAISTGSSGKLTIIMHIVITSTDALTFEINPNSDSVTEEQLTTAIALHDASSTAHGDIRANIDETVSVTERLSIHQTRTNWGVLT